MTVLLNKHSSRPRRRSFEQLEPRQLLDSEGVLAGADLHLTLSFAPDGADIAGQINSLAAKFDALAPTAEWQATILRAFQTWAVETNADVGMVDDGGQPFGTAGPTQGDERFGDIRIGAVALAPSTGAVSVPTDSLVAGTWFADVVFNTTFDFASLDDLYAIALHEAGNVFGLKDNADPNSPMSNADPPVVNLPTADDLAALQALHGVRAADANETMSNSGSASLSNDSFANATRLERGEVSGFDTGSAPTIVYGDIATNTDVDYFKIRGPGEYEGPLTVTVRSAGISLLAPQLQVFDGNEQPIADVAATDLGGGVAQYQIAQVVPGADYFFRVSAAQPGDFDRGGYSLTAVFDELNVIDQATIDHVSGGAYRFLDAKDIAEFFDGDGDDELFGDDMHADDELAAALELQTVPGFVENSRYQVVASIADAVDVDFYAIESPDFSTTELDVLTATVRSLDTAGLVPKLRLLDEHGVEIPAVVLANGNSEYIIQSTATPSDDSVRLEVSAADPGGFFDTGNYELSVAFGPTATQVTALASAAIGDGVAQRTHTLHVGEPQLFHFALQADVAATSPPIVLFASVVDDFGSTVFQLASRPGETRTGPAVLLAPGSYRVEVVAATLDGSALPEFGYTISGTAISDPFVGDPTDPTSNPFACPDPDLAGFFCYPGDPPIVSPNPFLWDNFVDSLPDPPAVPDLTTLINLLLGDWWRWVWNDMGANGPVLAQNDTFHVPSTPLNSPGDAIQSISSVDGVLGNDVDPENGVMAAMIVTGPSHGTLSLSPDGGFEYAPDPGFSGLDQFTYQVTDFVNVSNAGVAKIVVGDSGDFDAGGSVAGADFLAWQSGYGVASGAKLADGDADLDGAVNSGDLSVWEQQFSEPPVAAQFSGIAETPTSVPGREFLMWQRAWGTLAASTDAAGDFAFDGVADPVDRTTWSANFGAVEANVEGATKTMHQRAAVLSDTSSNGSDARWAQSAREVIARDAALTGWHARGSLMTGNELVLSLAPVPAGTWPHP